MHPLHSDYCDIYKVLLAIAIMILQGCKCQTKKRKSLIHCAMTYSFSTVIVKSYFAGVLNAFKVFYIIDSGLPSNKDFIETWIKLFTLQKDNSDMLQKRGLSALKSLGSPYIQSAVVQCII